MFHVKPIIELESESKKGKIKIMGYPAFGKVKTIVLPIAKGDNLSISEYKEKYGIDLKEYLFVDASGNLYFDTSKYLFLVRLIDADRSTYHFNSFNVIISSLVTTYDAGSTDATLQLMTSPVDEADWSIKFEIDKDVDFLLDNVRISYYEI